MAAGIVGSASGIAARGIWTLLHGGRKRSGMGKGKSGREEVSGGGGGSHNSIG